MNTLLQWLALLPAIITAAIQSVHAMETGFQAVADSTGANIAKAGTHKAAVLDAALQAILTTVQGVSADAVAKVFANVRDAAVAAFNAIGVFKKAA